MSRLLRNKEGCWTCRLRRKKCDGTRPECSTCTSLAIPCYGFGPRPDWMDHGEKEKAVATSLKQVVKHSSRRKASTRMPSRLMNIAPKSLKEASSSSSSPGLSIQQDGTHPPENKGSSEDIEDNTAKDKPSTNAVPPGHDHEDLVLYPIAADESACLMHYLDNVFPLQFPMYKPSVLEGGRGWLMALLLKMKPLYHATLALSSYHRRKVALREASHHMCQVASVIEQEKHLATCLAEFQQIIRSINESLQTSTCAKKGTGVLALIVQLIFFEYFTGQGTEWQIHLNAATDAYSRGLPHILSQCNLGERSKTIMHDDLPVLEGEHPLVIQEAVTLRFLTVTVVWLDIISAITAGTAPRLVPNHDHEIVWNCSQTKFENVIGCKAWVLLQIGRIAALHAHKTQALTEYQSTNLAFQETVNDIGKEIQGGLNQIALEGFCLAEGGPCDNPSASSTLRSTAVDERTIITNFYTYMASIYLHLVTHGFQQMEMINPNICAALGMLHTQVPTHLLPSLVCPLFVIGCVAPQEVMPFFRQLFSSPPLLDELFEHRMKLLPVLEETWRRRQTTDNLSWTQLLELTANILLI